MFQERCGFCLFLRIILCENVNYFFQFFVNIFWKMLNFKMKKNLNFPLEYSALELI